MFDEELPFRVAGAVLAPAATTTVVTVFVTVPAATAVVSVFVTVSAATTVVSVFVTVPAATPVVTMFVAVPAATPVVIVFVAVPAATPVVFFLQRRDRRRRAVSRGSDTRSQDLQGSAIRRTRRDCRTFR